MSRPIGILGGTFDPVHHGHLRMAIECYEQLGLEEVRFIPLKTPPHRQKPVANPELRLAMLNLAINNIRGLTIDKCELQREDVSYTIDTVKLIRAQIEDTPLCLLLGTDAFRWLYTWKNWESLLDFVHIVVAERLGQQPGTLNPELTQLLANHKTDQVDDLKNRPAGKIFEIRIPSLDISATRIREIFKNNENPAFLLPDEVINYIYTNNIYQKAEP